MQTGYWRTGKGEKIRICDMENEHLINTIKFLERGAKKRKGAFEDIVRPEYWLFLEELEYRIKNDKIIGFEVVGHRVYFKRS